MQVAPESRRVGMMFRTTRCSHLTVAQSVAFGLRKLDRAARAREIEEMLELVGLSHAAASYPHEISGGQQQRVALAGRWRPRPSCCCWTSPSPTWMWTRASAGLRSARDPEGHRSHRHPGHAQPGRGLRHRRPHRRDEQGRIAQWDTPYNLHHHPADAFVRDFIRSEALEDSASRSSRAAAERSAGGQDLDPGRPRERRHPGHRHFRPGVNPPTASPSATRP